MPELRLTIGLPASGKTTYAKKLVEEEPNWVRINWDEERIKRGMHLRKFNRVEEDAMQTEMFLYAETMGRLGHDIIVDNTNLREGTRNKWKNVAQRAKMNYTEITMGTHLKDCIERDSKREGMARCGRAVIERMALFAGMINFYQKDRLVLVDMDGTLADGSHRSPYSEDVLQDKPRQDIIQLVWLLSNAGFTIVIVSGRQTGPASLGTEAWLKIHAPFPIRHLFMRNGGDNRKDAVVKQEILDKLPKDQIAYVLDDRNQVVEMWRKNGLTCLQVAEGNF